MVTPRTCFLFITIQLVYVISAQEMEKRVPQGFVGMRGKKYDEPTEQFYKRKPQFFVGVKGKKSIFDLLEEPEEKRAPMGFVGMRGKKELYLPETYYGNYDYVPKRGAGSLIGQIDFASNEDVKSFSGGDEFPILNEILNEYLQKVERSNSLESATDVPDINAEFSNERISNEVDKRAANIHQFFGVRGKKSIQNKRPYDLSFRGKFIGVRGKKDLKNSGPQEIRFLLSPNGPWPKRKAQMGFVGMRGKKWTDESSLEMEIPN
ncbi:tachykinins-like [Ostrinia nubilalis]|uniref:tachykinins-like n=1 Tax=Ostrinia furnacalis TaxID=93504 RepID=UPI00103CC093|nr:tachykinins-like [Ostrinia furnacalis]